MSPEILRDLHRYSPLDSDVCQPYREDCPQRYLESLKDNLHQKKGWIGLTTMKVESKQYVTGEPSASSRLFSREKKKKRDGYD